MRTIPTRPTSEFRIGLTAILASSIALWVILSTTDVPGLVIATALPAAAFGALILYLWPRLVGPRSDVGWLFLLFVMTALLPASAKATEPAPKPAQQDISEEILTKADEALTDAARNLEKYRAEIEALIRGAPSFADSRSRLALPRSLPGDPLAGALADPVIGMAPSSEHAARQRNTSTLMVFLTLTMPDEALAGWLDQTARAGGVAVIRGFHGDRLSATLKRLTALQELAPATREHGGVSIDPTAFARFAVDVAPTVIVSAAPLPPCATRGCASDPAPAHDRIAGNVTLGHALRMLAADGDQATGVARHHLTRLEAPAPEDDTSGQYGGGP